MNFETLRYETSGHLSTITLNRPDKRNAISIQMIAELQAALDEIERKHTRVVILTGEGKAFCGHRSGLFTSDRATVRRGESRRFQTNRENVPKNLELLSAVDR